MELLKSFSGNLPIKRFFEPNPGQCHARNCAVRHANGAYILWTDDEVLVDQKWVVNLAFVDSDAMWLKGSAEEDGLR